MARIRILHEWLRNPIAPVTSRRSLMVVADTWAEQKVLMRAYATCRDQARPSIVLHGSALAIGPAGIEPHGPWGVHVDQERDGRAQELREALELAARRLAGTTGTPPRLVDEATSFERRATNVWAPGTRRARESQPPLMRQTPPEPIRLGGADQAAVRAVGSTTMSFDAGRAASGAAPSNGDDFERRATRDFDRRTTGRFASVRPLDGEAPVVARQAAVVFTAHPDARTIMPFGPQSATGEPPPAQPLAAPAWSSAHSYPRAQTPPPSERTLGKLVALTLPLGFALNQAERGVLDRLDRAGVLTVAEIAELAGVADGDAWMRGFMARLSAHGLDLVTPGDARDGQPTYALR